MPADESGHESKRSLPDYFQKYFDSLKSEGKAHSEQAEREAYAKMQSQIEREKDQEIKQFMQDVLDYCQDGSMLLSYVLEDVWHQQIKEQRTLQKEVRPIELYIALESILANQSDSYAYTKNFGPRYPLTIPGNSYGGTSKRVHNVDTNVPRAGFLNSYYKFGVHEFRVGHAIKNILDHLAERYGLDFKELEHMHQHAVKRKP